MAAPELHTFQARACGDSRDHEGGQEAEGAAPVLKGLQPA